MSTSGIASSIAWRTVLGGSRRYVEKMAAQYRDLRLGCAVTSIARTAHGIVVKDSHGQILAGPTAVIGPPPAS